MLIISKYSNKKQYNVQQPEVNIYTHRFLVKPELQVTGFPTPSFPNTLGSYKSRFYTLLKAVIFVWYGFILLVMRLYMCR